MIFRSEAVITRRSESSTRDGHGNLTLADADPVTVRGFAQQDNESDTRRDRDQSTSDWWVFLPAGTGLDRGDRVQIQGVTLEVAGRPRDVRTPRGAHHLEARCRLVEG